MTYLGHKISSQGCSSGRCTGSCCVGFVNYYSRFEVQCKDCGTLVDLYNNLMKSRDRKRSNKLLLLDRRCTKDCSAAFHELRKRLTDSRCCDFQTTNYLSSQEQRWPSSPASSNFTIQYWSGLHSTNADALPRVKEVLHELLYWPKIFVQPQYPPLSMPEVSEKEIRGIPKCAFYTWRHYLALVLFGSWDVLFYHFKLRV